MFRISLITRLRVIATKWYKTLYYYCITIYYLRSEKFMKPCSISSPAFCASTQNIVSLRSIRMNFISDDK